jgi:hypothetical protein
VEKNWRMNFRGKKQKQLIRLEGGWLVSFVCQRKIKHIKCEPIWLYPEINENHRPLVSEDLASRNIFLNFSFTEITKGPTVSKAPLFSAKILYFHWFLFVSKQSWLWEIECENVPSLNSSHSSLQAYNGTLVW